MAGTDQLSAVFAALADPTRRAIPAGLADRDATVTELTAPLSISMPTSPRSRPPRAPWTYTRKISHDRRTAAAHGAGTRPGHSG